MTFRKVTNRKNTNELNYKVYLHNDKLRKISAITYEVILFRTVGSKIMIVSFTQTKQVSFDKILI